MTSSLSPLYQLRCASVHYGPSAHAVRSLSGINLSIALGERVALVGTNGSGKSTLLRLLHGLVAPTSGQVVRVPHLRQAMVFQHPHMLRLSVQTNIALGLWLSGSPWAAAKASALAALARVGLAALAARPACKLSSGQQQRVALARAWAMQPQVLLLDEPTASLDPRAKREVEALIETFPATLVFASHNLGQVKRLASRVIYLEQGRVLADLPVHDFFNGPLLPAQYPAAHLFVKGESL
jgi:tungstate transport system ATP-binding protein